jgi:site-specific DNA-methyltransferase (adenine-specific)
MTLIDAIREFFHKTTEPVHVQDLYTALPGKLQHSVRARIYERLGKEFQRVGRGLYVAIDGPAVCVVAQGDAWEEIQKLETGSIDMVLTDPPYPWIDHFIGKGTTRPRMRWDFERREIDVQLGLEIHRVLKEGAHCFIFVPAETEATRPHINSLIERLGRCGLRFNKRWIWDKVHPGMGYSGRARYEGILFLSKGQKRQPCDHGITDVLSVPLIAACKRRHPTEKPVKLLESIIRFATTAGETVLDIFAGAGTTGLAALGLGRNSIMIEKDAEILKKALALGEEALCHGS